MPIRGIKVATKEDLREPRISGSNVTGKKCWNWSIHPLIVLASFLGVDLTQTSKFSQKWKTACGLIGLIIHAALTVNSANIFSDQIYQMLNIYFGEGVNHSRTYFWILIVDFVNFEVCCYVIHLILVLRLKKKWSSLSKAFQYPTAFFDAGCYDRLRRFSFIGVAYIIFGAACLGIIFAMSDFSVKTLPIKLLLLSGSFLPLYPTFCIVLFSTVCYSASLAFQSIASNLKGRGDLQSLSLSSTEVIVLKSYYISICQTVDVVNDCFGCLLLLVVPHLFVATITITFYWFGHAEEISVNTGVIFFLLCHVNFFIICIAADSVRVESEKVLKKLLRFEIKPERHLCRKQVHDWVLQIALASPRISALGFFHVDKMLIPTMIGTTLTYYIVLRQFHLSEEKL